MMLAKKQLFSLIVVTTRGIAIGRIVDVELDSISQSIVTYQVRPYWKWRKTLQGGMILPFPLRIQRSQVVRMTATELIVEDTSVPVSIRENAAVRSTRQARQEAAIRAPL